MTPNVVLSSQKSSTYHRDAILSILQFSDAPWTSRRKTSEESEKTEKPPKTLTFLFVLKEAVSDTSPT